MPETDKAKARRRAIEMRKLPDDDRRAAIATGENVIGFGRFIQAAKQVQLSDAYRRPTKPEGAA